MFEKLLIEQAAPTLAGIKPASLFPYCADSLEHAFNEIAEWDRKLSVSGIRIMALCSCEEKNRVLVYSYRITALNKLLSDGDTMDFLVGCGYDTCDQSCENMLRQLALRTGCVSGMPHEIGVFLGYPLEDVEGFIKNNGKNHSFCGYWKAYGDPEEAMKRYTQLRKCNDVYRKLYSSGRSVMELAITA